jgi:hypothetical protein
MLGRRAPHIAPVTVGEARDDDRIKIDFELHYQLQARRAAKRARLHRVLAQRLTTPTARRVLKQTETRLENGPSVFEEVP